MQTELNSNNLDEDYFWSESYPKLQKYCHFLTQNKWDGDDIAQEAFLKATNYYHQSQLNSALLNKIAYNHWLDIHRKRKKEPTEGENQLHVYQQIDMIPETIDALLNQFTPKQAVIFFLKEGFHYQTKEIADILNTTEMAVKSNLHRAKKRLEKESHNDQLLSIGSFWNEKERVLLSDLFNESLKQQDPSVLIQSIPSIKSVADVPQMVSVKFRPIQSRTDTPSGTLCMAA